MKRNDPTSNNPTNPLEKVAALTISRGDEQTKKPGNITTVPVHARLNFKKSHHLAGRAKDRAGQSINISFSMSIVNAHFELSASFADDSSSNGQLALSKLAHEIALVVPVTVKSKGKTTKKKKTEAKGNVSAKASSKLHASKAEADGKLSGDISVEHGETATKDSQYKSLNITVTGAGTRATWDIQPVEGTSHLVGEVFMSTENQQILAAILTRGASSFGKPFELSACLRVLPQHLIIENVKFTDDTGEPVSIGDLDPLLVPGGRGVPRSNRVIEAVGGDRVGLNDHLRARIAKEIIRRHLKDCGLDVDRPDIEICKARG